MSFKIVCRMNKKHSLNYNRDKNSYPIIQHLLIEKNENTTVKKMSTEKQRNVMTDHPEGCFGASGEWDISAGCDP